MFGMLSKFKEASARINLVIVNVSVCVNTTGSIYVKYEFHVTVKAVSHTTEGQLDAIRTRRGMYSVTTKNVQRS